MVRTYKRKLGSRRYKDYDEDIIEQALKRVLDHGWAVNKACKHFHIPYGTLYNKYKGLHRQNHGGQTVFRPQEERAIITSAITCSDWGFPLCVEDLQMITKSFLDRQGRQVAKFKNGMPGREWVYSMLKRHNSILTQRMASNIKRARAGVSPEIISEYFRHLEESIKDVPASNVFNYDETNMADDPGKKRFLYHRGKKYPENVINHSKSAISIMFCGSASGVLLPPYAIYKSEHMWDSWTKGGPKGHPCCEDRCCLSGTRYNRTKSGWIEASCFTEWFTALFLPHAVRLPGKKVLIGDNLSSHFTDEVLELCQGNNISFICLPANSTHLTQPLDVSFFRPLKSAWRLTLLKWKTDNPKQTSLKKEEFPGLLKVTLSAMNNSGANAGDAIKHNLMSGFEATGIHPFNPSRVLSKIPSESPNEEQFRGVYEENLVSYLKQKRYSNTPVRKGSQKKKRLNVVPGKSVTCPSSHSESESVDEATQNSPGNMSPLSNEAEDVDYLSVDPNILVKGAFILVRVLSGKRNATVYRYLSIVQEELEYNEYNVLGLKSIDTIKKVFKVVENDRFTVQQQDIIAIVEKPQIELVDNIQRYVFENSVDVYEK